MASKLSKANLGRELVRRGVIGGASILRHPRWDAAKGKWVGEIDYGPEGLGRFTLAQMSFLVNNPLTLDPGTDEERAAREPLLREFYALGK